jgi:hypothetical protein
MRDLVRLIVWAVVDLLRSRAAIEAEILTLRQQIIVLRRTAAKKQTFGAIDRLVFVGLYRLFPSVLDALAIVRPGTVIKWHRAGFRLYWLCVPKTLSELMRQWNRLSWRNDQAVLFRSGRPGLAVQVEGTCAYRKSHPAILMVQSAQDRAADEIPGPLNAARDRGILVQ